MQQGATLPGDVLLITAFISYVGCFTKQFRLDLLNKHWLPFLRNIDPAVPITDGLDPLSLLTDDTQIAKWNNEGLPNDRMSTENATILTNSDRWPLMIDPQVNAIKQYLRLLRNFKQRIKSLIIFFSASRYKMDQAKVWRRTQSHPFGSTRLLRHYRNIPSKWFYRSCRKYRGIC